MPAKTSAGLLLYRRGGGEIEVLLVHPGGPFTRNKDEGAWSIPKGEIEPGEEENLLARARIEFREELGADPPSGPYIELGAIKQKGGKTVHAWACEGDFTGPARSNTFDLEWPPASGKIQQFPEIDRAEWFPLVEARVKINPAQASFLDSLTHP